MEKDVREFTFEPPEGMPNYWDYSDAQLAQSCAELVQKSCAESEAQTRAEAMRLTLLWHEVLSSAGEASGVRSDCAPLLSSLRKRTIQVLIRVSLRGTAATPER